MELPDGRKNCKVGLAVLMQYRRVTDSQPPSQPATLPYHIPRYATLIAKKYIISDGELLRWYRLWSEGRRVSITTANSTMTTTGPIYRALGKPASRQNQFELSDNPQEVLT